jgi:glucokinase
MARRSRLPLLRVVGADVGGSKVSAAVVDAAGRVLSHGGKALHQNEGPDEVIDQLAAVVRRSFNGGAPPAAIGVGVAGQVDAASGVVRHAPNLRWREVPLGARLAREFGCPIVVVNDVRAATVGEWRRGAGQGARNLLCIFVGTGVGGSVVADGHLLEGAANALGEVGHSVLVAGGRACHCPSRGCLEAYVGGWAIAERAQEKARADPAAGAELRRRAGSLTAIEARTVGEAARAGDPLAREILRETGDYLALGVAGLVNAFNPDRLLLGGGVIEGTPEMIETVASRIRSSCQPPAAEAVSVARVALGADAILIGAAELARDRLGGAPATRARPRTRRRPGGRAR